MSDPGREYDLGGAAPPKLADGLIVELPGGVNLIYGTPLLHYTVPQAPEINPGLAKAILAREQEQPGARLSNVGGWQSPTDLLSWELPAIGILKSAIGEAMKRISTLSPELSALPPNQRQISVEAWANINRAGHYNRLHTHPGSHWSGVYYVDIGSPEPGRHSNGVISLHDPRHISAAVRNPGFPFGHHLEIQPVAGMLLLFPSWLEHWVSPFHGEGQRISIAFNIQLRVTGA